jgi:hypothetical protein
MSRLGFAALPLFCCLWFKIIVVIASVGYMLEGATGNTTRLDTEQVSERRRNGTRFTKESSLCLSNECAIKIPIKDDDA